MKGTLRVSHFVLTLTSVALGLVWVPIATGQTLARADKLKRCQGEAVFLLPGQDGQFRMPGQRFVSKTDEPVIKDAIGKSGTVVGTAPDAGGGPGDSRFVVKLKDSAQSLEVIGNYETLGFSSELEKAKQFIGLQLWTTGLNRFMSSVKDLEQYYSWQWQPVIATPASKVTIEGVEWGSVQFPIVFHIRTGDGRAALWPIQRARPFDLTCRFDSYLSEKEMWSPTDGGS